MNRSKCFFLAAVISVRMFAQSAPPALPAAPAAPALPDARPAPPAMFDDVDRALAQAQSQLRSLNIQIPPIDLAGIQSKLADLQERLPFALQIGIGAGSGSNSSGAQVRVRSGVSGDIQYDNGTRRLDEGKYDEAIRDFDRVIASKSTRADGAAYWKAYALNRLGHRDEALAAIAALRRDYPNSRWLNDAQALEVEVRQNSGQPVSPADETNEDLKLMAINSLMNSADPDKVVPLLEGIIKGGSTPKVKDRALFVLTQSHSPRARQVLADLAKGSANPDLQLRAIIYLAASGAPGTQQELMTIYGASTDTAVKKEILRALVTAGVAAQLLDVARTEKDPDLRLEAVRAASMSRGVDFAVLAAFYASQNDAQAKTEIIRALAVRGDARDLVDLARKETHPELKKLIVEHLSTMRNNKDATDYMLELLK